MTTPLTAEQRKELEELADVTVNGSWFFGQLAARLAKGIQSLLAQLKEAERERDNEKALKDIFVADWSKAETAEIIALQRAEKAERERDEAKAREAVLVEAFRKWRAAVQSGEGDANERFELVKAFTNLPTQAAAHLEHVRKLEDFRARVMAARLLTDEGKSRGWNISALTTLYHEQPDAAPPLIDVVCKPGAFQELLRRSQGHVLGEYPWLTEDDVP